MVCVNSRKEEGKNKERTKCAVNVSVRRRYLIPWLPRKKWPRVPSLVTRKVALCWSHRHKDPTLFWTGISHRRRAHQCSQQKVNTEICDI